MSANARATGLGALMLLAGCDLILGIQDWTDPANSTTGGGGDTTATSSSAGGMSSSTGSGGMPVVLTGTCADGVLDPGETDIDCGGDACKPCGPFDACLTNADCSTLLCVDLSCAETTPDPECADVDPENPTCNDCVQNAGESDIDCGGDVCLPCEAGDTCFIGADCVIETICTAGTCVSGAIPSCPPADPPDPETPTCIDCIQNGDETGVDCGGDACSPCP